LKIDVELIEINKAKSIPRDRYTPNTQPPVYSKKIIKTKSLIIKTVHPLNDIKILKENSSNLELNKHKLNLPIHISKTSIVESSSEKSNEDPLD